MVMAVVSGSFFKISNFSLLLNIMELDSTLPVVLKRNVLRPCLFKDVMGYLL